MTDFPAKSRFRYDQQQDGSCTVSGLEGVQIERVDIVPDTGRVRDWLGELGIPKDWAAIEAMAQPRGLSARSLRFVLLDESPTRFPGNCRVDPARIILPHERLFLTLGHLGYHIGLVEQLSRGYPRARLSDAEFMRALNPAPDLFLAPDEGPDPEGSFIIGRARLFNSVLADKAWQGLRWGVLTHMCGVVVWVPATGLPGTVGLILEAALLTADEAGCPGARILTYFEEET